MHRESQAEYKEGILPSVSLAKYRTIFNEYNVFCFLHQRRISVGNTWLMFHIQRSIINSTMEHDMHNIDRLAAKNNVKILVFNFDLQAVVSIPKEPHGQIFYLRKLAVYNLTVYNLGNQNGMCYLYNELEGKRRAVEIVQCINDYVVSQSNTEEV
ncbi:hypothetical protein PR048_016105 [Dryococelus australis]|uniref:Uncharacterized protein n=1 Tax=Dryococelus australis TaxID=614101 RepID=A0ABQ9HIU0_9NEOP|nr:hypothetical protein PR048_016105 [Dryococelus australis]